MFGSTREVGRSTEWSRIVALPRREATPSTLVDDLTALLKTPGGTQRLKPVQAQALYELGTYGCLFGPIGVGRGKTLITLLGPRVVECRRPLLIVPATLIGKTELDRADYAKNWRVAKGLRITSYEAMGRISAASFLELYQPDFIELDECHRAKNLDVAACARRIGRYIESRPKVIVAAMSGTIMAESIKDYAHIVDWTHKEGSPVPREKATLIEWSEAIDDKVNGLARRKPGVLGPDLPTARANYLDRVNSTPGVVHATDNTEYNGSLHIEAREYQLPKHIEEYFEKLRTDWVLPCGWPLMEAVEVWRHAREMAAGLHYVWNPRPPEQWLIRRKAYAKFVRETLTRTEQYGDSKKQIYNAIASGKLDDGGLLAAWEKIEPTFCVNLEPRWHDDTVLNICQEWLGKNEGICWVEHNFFAQELAARTRLPYYGAGGLDTNKNRIEQARGPIIASIAANCTGRNLQYYNKNLVVSISSNAGRWEQFLGRTHRDGQRADEVSVEFLFGCWEHWNSIDRARRKAHTIEQLAGQPQKLASSADIIYPDTVSGRSGWQWKKTESRQEEDE